MLIEKCYNFLCMPVLCVNDEKVLSQDAVHGELTMLLFFRYHAI
jgi:hypothetical protein